MTPDQDIATIIDLIKQSYGAAAGGALAAISAIMYGLVKVLRLNLIQKLLARISPKLAWIAWPKWVCMLVVFLLTFAGALLSALALGTPILAAVIASASAAIPVALGSMGIDAAVNAAAPTTDKPTVAPLPDSKPNP